jgi:periplasmic divalent cation tolerance protein
MRIVYITAKDAADAKRISHHLLEKRLIACANIFPVQSMYRWDGKIQDIAEYAILAKTGEGRFGDVEKEVRSIHLYEVPSIYSWKADKASKDYEDWIIKETK